MSMVEGRSLRWAMTRLVFVALFSLAMAAVTLSFFFDAVSPNEMKYFENILYPSENHMAENNKRTLSTGDMQDAAEELLDEKELVNDETEPSGSDQPMNIVLLYADDWSFRTLGSVGGYAKTPQLDELATRGVLFTHNCVTTSICMQSRATLYTGQYSSRHETFFSWRNVTMFEGDRWKFSLYPLMYEAGYYNGFFGKW